MSPIRSRFIILFKRLSAAASVIVFLVGCIVLLGWVFDINSIKSILPVLATMKANTALSFVLSGVALFIFTKEWKNSQINYWGYACTTGVLLIAGLTLLEYVTGWNLGIDQLLFTDNTVGMLLPGRMAIATAINFFMLGFALTLSGMRRNFGLIQVLTFITFISALLAISGYVYGVSSLYRIFPFGSVAVHTATTIVILCLGILWSRPEQGLMSMVASEGIAGIMLRRLLPATLILPIVIGWLRLKGEQAGYYGGEFGLALFALSDVIIFTCLAGLTARIIHNLDNERTTAEAALRQAHNDLETRVEERTVELESINKQLSMEIVERRQAEDALRKSEARFEGIFRLAEDAIISVNLDQRIMMFNQGAERIFGYNAEEVFGQSLDWLLPVQALDKHREHIHEFVNSTSVSRRMAQRQEILGRRKGGLEFPAEATISKVKIAGETTLTVMLRDISERKRAEDSLKKSLQEKELLLKEIHHRVKNNLQVVSSLLHLQFGFIKDDTVLEMFKDSQNRIHSMALVHELLYRSADLARIDFADYVRSLVNDLLMSYGVNDQTIHTSIEIGSFPMNVDRAIPCGLIINELVSNALKHAFPDGGEAHITISLNQEGNQNLVLSIRDDGIGLPAEIDIKQTKTLGLQLVHSLCRQLQGSLEIHNKSGTEFRVIFPALPPNGV